jgi:hypothetical protein
VIHRIDLSGTVRPRFRCPMFNLLSAQGHVNAQSDMVSAARDAPRPAHRPGRSLDGAPEFLVVTILVVNHRPAHGLALFLASSVSQWTLGMGTLPLAYSAGGGGISMPLAAREQLEVSFIIAVTLFVVAALATLRPERVDAYLILSIFVVQLIYPAPFIRFAATFVLLVFAIDLLIARRRLVRPLLRTGFGWRRVAR